MPGHRLPPVSGGRTTRFSCDNARLGPFVPDQGTQRMGIGCEMPPVTVSRSSARCPTGCGGLIVVLTSVNVTWTTARPAADVRRWVGSSMVDTLRRYGYRVESDTPDELVLTHRAPSSWPLLLFSVFAYLLSQHRSYQVVFKFLTTPEGLTRLLVIGDLPAKVADVLRDLPGEP
jgi:hypothetical protein